MRKKAWKSKVAAKGPATIEEVRAQVWHTGLGPMNYVSQLDRPLQQIARRKRSVLRTRLEVVVVVAVAAAVVWASEEVTHGISRAGTK